MNDNIRLAELLFPLVTQTPADYEIMFPERKLKDGGKVTRFAPSPTGFIHLGNLFTAFVNFLAAKASDGTVFLRIEDTDKKREVENGVAVILNCFKGFGLNFDEGAISDTEEKGAYGPYFQRKRAEIYHCIAKELVKNGLAYPCFCSEEELNNIRDRQEALNVNKGYYNEFAKCRNLTFEEQETRIKNGEPFVLRLRSQGDESKHIIIEDLIRGKIEMPEDIMDIVLLKSDGIPTYHFAHCVDDHFMRTTTVIRGDEWLASVPTHIALFKATGYKPPKYAHVAPVMKEENGNKRKLSKRKDPEAAVSFFSEQGFPKECVLEYLLTLINSNFEDWRRANGTADIFEFPFSLKKMSPSGALFDIVKLNDISKNIISVMSAEQVCEKALEWASEYDRDLYDLLIKDTDFFKAVMGIDRGIAKPRKDIAKWNEIKEYIEYFYDELYTPDFELPENVSKEDALKILEAYLKVFNINDDKDMWFERMKSICPDLGYTPNVKEYKSNPEQFKGHIGDVSTVIRLAVTSRKNTPDLYSIFNILGEDKIRQRIDNTVK